MIGGQDASCVDYDVVEAFSPFAPYGRVDRQPLVYPTPRAYELGGLVATDTDVYYCGGFNAAGSGQVTTARYRYLDGALASGGR